MLEIHDLEVFYGPAQVIFGLEMKVELGKITAIIGSNGAGKSTLLYTLSGVLRQKSGTINLEGIPIQNLPVKQRVAKGLILCPERRRLFPNLRVKDNIKLGAYLRKDNNSNLAQDLKKVYELFPVLEDREEQLAGTLSGGEQQMVAIARSLMSKPKLLMLDEPSVGLSPILRERIFEAIIKIKETSNGTVLIVEQDAADALSMADYVYVLESGQIAMSGKRDEIAGNPHVRESYLGL